MIQFPSLHNNSLFINKLLVWHILADEVIPFFSRQVAIHLFLHGFHHLVDTDVHRRYVAFRVTHPERFLRGVKLEVHNPVAGLQQGHRLNLIVIADPQIHAAVVTRRIEAPAIHLHF